MTDILDTVPYSFVEADRRFRGAYCLRYQSDDEGSKHLRNVGLLQRNYTALYHLDTRRRESLKTQITSNGIKFSYVHLNCDYFHRFGLSVFHSFPISKLFS
jgi:hypothetical protein